MWKAIAEIIVRLPISYSSILLPIYCVAALVTACFVCGIRNCAWLFWICKTHQQYQVCTFCMWTWLYWKMDHTIMTDSKENQKFGFLIWLCNLATPVWKVQIGGGGAAPLWVAYHPSDSLFLKILLSSFWKYMYNVASLEDLQCAHCANF